MLVGEAAICYAHWFTGIAFLWYNVIGCVVVVVTGVILSHWAPAETEPRR
jgi:solute:Na+ symporter, SSS family